MLFLGMISWNGASRFNGWVCFSDGGGASFLSGGCAPWGVLVLMGEVFKKNSKMGEVPPPMPPPTIGNPGKGEELYKG